MFYNIPMRIAKTVCITLPPNLLKKAQRRAAREHRTMSELFREALRRYMAEGGPGHLAGDRAKTGEQDTAAGDVTYGKRQDEGGPTVVHSFRMQKPQKP